ncbi:EscU/YscU/HrcU family type III secretion system export apparatus switch protein [Paenirhodobacter sp.]|uniref:EscU/YscU/HrcU family type III secretion system export apparatus switch protein n=1 Tax=Paenirhodobacter sp. TaxID=1965326 RepID=UPI003B41C8B9
MSEQEAAEKEFEPTPHKLAEARKKGDLVRSQELAVAASYIGFLVVAFALGGRSLMRFGEREMVLLDQADRLSQQMLGGGAAAPGALLGTIGITVLPWFIGPAVLVILVLVAQRAIVVAPDKIMPKLSRINPIANAGQKFGRSGMFEFFKSFVKLMLIATILGWFLTTRVERIVRTQNMAPEPALIEMFDLLLGFAVIMAVVAAAMGAIDYFWQRMEFLRRNKMSRKELTDEMKHSDGDPHMKQQRRQRAMEIASRQMMADVPKADVVIVNPTHYAVALKWDRAAKRPPVCVAKGVDEIAAKIRALAMESGVPIHPDPPTARALHAALDIGEEIHPEHYRTVAAAIRFSERMRRLARERRGY